MAIINVLVGVALLFFGRRAFWLFVAGAGFVAGLALANNILEVPESVGLIIGIGIGLLAALLAVFVQRFAINLAGFMVGGYIALQLLPMLNIEGGWWATMLTFIIGGVVGVILVGLFLDWALISLSSLAGAALVMDALNLSGGLGMVTFIILIVIGIVFQGRELRGNRRRKR
jgi:hypothetical protein